jgi:hypothetical protein
LALDAGNDLKTVASILGHNPQMLLAIYQQVRPERRSRAIQSVVELLA